MASSYKLLARQDQELQRLKDKGFIRNKVSFIEQAIDEKLATIK